MSVTLTVPPRVSVNASTVVLRTGNAVSLYCQVTGIPTPDVEWVKRGAKSLSNHSSIVTSITSTYATAASILHVTNAQPSDSGEFVCEAANKVGTANTTSILDVQCNLDKSFDLSDFFAISFLLCLQSLLSL